MTFLPSTRGRQQGGQSERDPWLGLRVWTQCGPRDLGLGLHQRVPHGLQGQGGPQVYARRVWRALLQGSPASAGSVLCAVPFVVLFIVIVIYVVSFL